jgi:hypothetical protein
MWRGWGIFQKGVAEDGIFWEEVTEVLKLN